MTLYEIMQGKGKAGWLQLACLVAITLGSFLLSATVTYLTSSDLNNSGQVMSTQLQLGQKECHDCHLELQ